MQRFGIVLSAVLAVTASAQAADLNWSSPAASPIYSSTPASGWSGFYAGINGGYAWGNSTTNPALPGSPATVNNSGWTIGGQAGYNFDMGGFVLGAEADLQWANIAFSTPAGAAGNFDAVTDVFGTARIRAGIPVGQVMPYATIGGAYGHGTAKITNNQNVVTSQTANHMGWAAGVGLEAQATPNLSFKAEYLYVDLGKQTYAGLPVGNLDISPRFSVVRAGVNYKF